MCKPEATTNASTSSNSAATKMTSTSRRGVPRLLLSLDSFASDRSSSNSSGINSKHSSFYYDENSKPISYVDVTSSSNGKTGDTTKATTKTQTTSEENDEYDPTPDYGSCALTVCVIVAFFFGTEHLIRTIFEQNQHWHILLEQETNRLILARHIGVDALACTMCAIMGYMARHINDGIYTSILQNKPELMPASQYEQRLYTYHPMAYRVSLFFISYQIKNTYDTIVWGDGPEFIFHHVLSILTAWGAMKPGCGHPYTIFFFGLSEISTAVLCLLANFDDVHGVPGLGDALPIPKIIVGAVFVTLFILCRCIMWPINCYYFCRDISMALKAAKAGDPRAIKRKFWFQFFLVSCTGISMLQILWLGQIFIIAQEEIAKAGFM